jgi:hypothetical protein
MHWEVRKEICSSLIHISKYLGPEASKEFILPELKELLEDEEGEVASEAIYQFQKHLTYIFEPDFCRSEEAILMFVQLCENAAEYDLTMVDLALVLKLLTKFLFAFNLPREPRILAKVYKMIEKAQDATFEEEIRAMLPCTFRGLTQTYFCRMDVLVDLYQKHLSGFIEKELETGQPEPPSHEATPEKKAPACIYFDLFEKEKDKHYRETNEDKNFLVNKGIAQNLHYLLGAFVTYIEDKSDGSPPADGSLTDSVVSCALDVLQHFQKLLMTKDRELLHFALFTFKNFHERIYRLDTWVRLSPEIQAVYTSILRSSLPQT